MLFLLKNHAPRPSLPPLEYSESNTVVKLYRESNQPDVIVYANAGDVWYYIHGNISQSGNEKEARRTLKAKYDYQLKKLGVKPDASYARQMISAALAKLGLKPRNNSFTPLYGMPSHTMNPKCSAQQKTVNGQKMTSLKQQPSGMPSLDTKRVR